MFDIGTVIQLATTDHHGNILPARPGIVAGIDRRQGVVVVELDDGETVVVDDPDALTA